MVALGTPLAFTDRVLGPADCPVLTLAAGGPGSQLFLSGFPPGYCGYGSLHLRGGPGGLLAAINGGEVRTGYPLGAGGDRQGANLSGYGVGGAHSKFPVELGHTLLGSQTKSLVRFQRRSVDDYCGR